ncbi:CD109 antigen-like, partial [Ruditapes philippinarum]|uniref:CD109 antigen-like n=1 Tax=Ruditapes philippinarum TaxID=129788 RepID=UPI00295C1D99
MIVNRKRELEVRPMTIDILDGDKTRIRRWANVSDNSGVFVGKMEMSEYPVLGTWTINVKSEGLSKSQEFDVKEYELPKFDITVEMPQIISSNDINLEGNVSSKYTFGKGVTGSLEFTLSYLSRALTKIYKLDNGEVNIKIPTSDIYEVLRFSLSSYYSIYTVQATATVTEDITGSTGEDSTDIKFTKFNVDLKLDNPTAFLPGQPFEIKGRVLNKLGSAYDGEASDFYIIRLTVEYKSQGSYTLNKWISDTHLPIDSKNQFGFSLDGNLITNQTTYIKVKTQLLTRASGVYIRTLYTHAYPTKSADGSMLYIKQMSGTNPLNVGDRATYRVSMTGPGTEKATYKVMSKGVVIKSGPWFLISEDRPYDFDVQATSSMIPSIAVLCWFTLPNDRIKTEGSRDNVAASGVTTAVKDNALDKETSIAFDQETQRPGTDARIDLMSTPRSSFYVLAVDKSILILDEGNDITEAVLPSLYDPLLTNIKFSSSRSAYEFLSSVALSGLQFTGSQFSSSSLAELTTTTTVEPKSTMRSKLETVRKKFPDTWLFLNVSADSNGKASIVKKVPDTITTWVASCFTVSAESKISVATKNAEVMVTLKKSSQFRGLAVVKRGKRTVLEERCGSVAKAGRGTAAFFPIIPTVIGEIKITITATSSVFQDTVIKTLRVESEGAPRGIAFPIFIDLSEKTTFETRLDLNYPPNTVEGSQRMRISLIGDIMGPTLDGLERLVIMPYGCGEQNMISTAPSVFVYRYLLSVGKLTNEIKEKAENFMRKGMQRQLTYRHPDWSFSAWGGSGSGSTWLTAFVLKVFSIASNYVEIDSSLITGSANFL